VAVQLTFLDWAVVALYFAFNIGIGFYYKARAGKNTGEFFLGGAMCLSGWSVCLSQDASFGVWLGSDCVADAGVSEGWGQWA